MSCSIFFFFKQKTAYEISSRDWSSDVCSSDLPGRRLRPRPRAGRTTPRGPPGGCSGCGTSSNRLGLHPARRAFSSWRRTAVSSRVLEGGHAGERFPFEELERGPASGGDVGELVFEPGHGRGRISAPDDRRRAALPRLDQRLPDGAGPLVERRRLEHAHGAVPENGLGLQDPGAEVEAGGSIDVEDGVVAGDAIARHLLAFGGARETGRHDRAAGQNQLGPRLGEELFGEILLVAFDEGAAHLESDRE